MIENVKDQIAEKFIEMNKNGSMDKISVKDLVQECSISRQTFYYHYVGVFDVFEYIVTTHNKALVEKCIKEPSRKTALLKYVEFYASADDGRSINKDSKYRNDMIRVFRTVIADSIETILKDRELSVIQFVSDALMGFLVGRGSNRKYSKGFVRELSIYLDNRLE